MRKTEAESKKKRDQVLLWAEERKREEFQRRTVSKQFESSGDTSSLVLFLKSELEKLQIALSQKDKDIEQLVMDNTNEKTKLKSQLSELQEKFLQTNLQKEILEKRITERDLYVDKCKERIDTQSKTFDRFSEERNELDEEMNKLRKNLKEKQSLIQEHEDEIAALKITITELRTSLKSPESPKREEVNEEDTDENEEVIQHPHSARERYFYRDDDSEVETEENLDSTEEDEGFQNNIDSYFVNQENEEKV
jgi:chromosome segregation ATPase